MAQFVIPLPNNRTLVLVVPYGDQIVSVNILECECGCEQWFQPTEPHQVYFNPEHQQAGNNNKRRKTERRQKAS